MAIIRCNTAAHIPKESHYAIVTSSSVYIPAEGDYTSENRPIVEYVAYTVRSEWEAEISSRMLKGETNFKAITVKVPTITPSFKIDIQE